MRDRKVRILHDGREYFLLDRGKLGEAHVITLLKRLVAEDRPGEDAVVLHCDAGDCMPVASWTDGEVRVEPGHDALRDTFERLVERYLEEFRVGRGDPSAKAYFFLSSRRRPLFALTRAQPTGLTVLVFSDEEKAREAADAKRGMDAPDVEIERAGSLAGFLSARAAEGFTGASIDDRDPIFFCSDAEGLPRFLRLSLGDGGHVEQSLLDEKGAWSAYDGEEDLSLELDQEAADENMRERLGDVPYLGFREGQPLFGVAQCDGDRVPAAVRLDDTLEGEEFVPLFTEEALGESFLIEQELSGMELVPVGDLKVLVSEASRRNVPVLLHPTSHRARGGAMWLSDGHVVLDSFSGLWQSEDGCTFRKS